MRPSGHGSRRTAHCPASKGRPPVRALTSDVWYTLLYLNIPDQLRLDRARVRVWSAPLRRAGQTRREATANVRWVEGWAADAEAHGHTPTIAAQASELTHRSGVPVEADTITEGLDGLIDEFPIRVAPGAPAALARLGDAGIRLGVVSNLLHETGAGLRRLLASRGLLDSFSSLVLSSEHPWSKPRPEPFRTAVRELGCRPAESAHVGDLRYDVLGARRAGLTPLLYTGLHRHEPARLRELVGVNGPNLERVRRWADVPGFILGTR